MRVSSDNRLGRKAFLATIVVMAAYVWLMSNVPLVAMPYAGNDDGLFVRSAGFLLAGKWLGPYGPTMLSKGPLYSIWIAASWVSGLPLLVSQAILYAICCLALVRAVRPWLPSEPAAYAVFCVLLFNPVAYSEPLLRVVRDGVYTSLTILLLALSIGWVRAREESTRRRGAQAIGIGLLLGAYWCTREEGLWILPLLLMTWAVPCVALVAAASGPVMQRMRARRNALMREAVLGFAVAAVAGAVVACVALTNRAHYGVADVVELKQAEFLDAYGAFVRIRVDQSPTPYMIVSRAQRERAYAMSPAAAELRPNLDGPMMDGLVRSGCQAYAIAPCDGELRTGWFVWALREAASNAGHYDTATEARRFYAQIAKEIDTACRDGRLSCASPRRTLAPPFEWAFVPAALRTTARALGYMAMQDGLGVPRPAHSCVVDDCGSAPIWPTFLDLVHSSALFTGPDLPPGMSRIADNASISVPDDYRELKKPRSLLPLQLRAELIARILEGVISIYRLLVPYLIGLAVVAYVASAALSVAHRSVTPLLGIATGAAIVVLLRAGLLAYLDATSFPSINTLYLAPAYPALLLFGAAAILSLVSALKQRRLARDVLARGQQ